MTAQDARALTEKANPEEKILKELYEKIEKAATSGKSSITYPGSHAAGSVMTHLRQDSFDCKYETEYMGEGRVYTYWVISW